MTIIFRKAINGPLALALRGHPVEIAPDLAYIADGKRVTWSEVMDARRKHQRQRLDSIYQCKRVRAVWIDVRYYDQDLMGGWQTMYYGVGFSRWYHRTWEGHQGRLMDMFPPQQPSLFTRDFYSWQEWFAKAYKVGSFCGRPRGAAYVWAEVSGEKHWTCIERFLRPAILRPAPSEPQP